MSANPEERQIRASVPEGGDTFRTQPSRDERLELARKTLSACLALAGTPTARPPIAPSAAEKRRQSAALKAQTLRADSLRLLAQREHTAEELRRKLTRKQARRKAMTEGLGTEDESPSEESAPAFTGKADAEIEALLAELARRGWQSDQRYAEVMTRRLAGQVSQRMIRERLMQAGVSREDIEQAWSNLAEALPDDAVTAKELWKRRYGQAPAHEKERQRQIRFLLGRGFALSIALRAVPQARSGLDD